MAAHTVRAGKSLVKMTRFSHGTLECRTLAASRRFYSDTNQPHNLVAQDHRGVNRLLHPLLGFKSLWAARCTIAGIERGMPFAKGNGRAQAIRPKHQRGSFMPWLRRLQEVMNPLVPL